MSDSDRLDWRLSELLLACLWVTTSLAQAPPTLEQFLAQHHIRDNPLALRQALSDPDPEVRAIIPSLLALRGDADSIPLLEDALENDTKFSNQVNIAAALAALQDSRGLKWLTDKCTDEALEPANSMLAANASLKSGDQRCLVAVARLLSAKPSSDVTSLGLQYLKRAKDVPPETLGRIRVEAEKNLWDTSAEDRSNAGRILAAVGDAGSISALERAISAEGQEDYKHWLQDDLRILKDTLLKAKP